MKDCCVDASISINLDEDLDNIPAEGHLPAVRIGTHDPVRVRAWGERHGMGRRQPILVTVDLRGGVSEWGYNVCLDTLFALKQNGRVPPLAVLRFTTQIGHADCRRHFPKADIHRLFGKVGSGWRADPGL